MPDGHCVPASGQRHLAWGCRLDGALWRPTVGAGRGGGGKGWGRGGSWEQCRQVAERPPGQGHGKSRRRVWGSERGGSERARTGRAPRMDCPVLQEGRSSWSQAGRNHSRKQERPTTARCPRLGARLRQGPCVAWDRSAGWSRGVAWGKGGERGEKAQPGPQPWRP